MPTVLVAGANRGIGLEFARSYAADGWGVIGTARAPEQAEALRRTGARVEPLDLTDEHSIAALAARVDEPVDLLIANGGIYGDGALDQEKWQHVLSTNVIGPTLLAQALKPQVLRGAGRRMVALTSGMGSIAEAGGGHIPYRSSKAALNMAWRCLALDWAKDGIAVAVINPGWVQTDMGGPGASIAVDTSVRGMRGQIDGLNARSAGRFLSYDGRSYPW